MVINLIVLTGSQLTTLENIMKVTRINDEQLAITLPTGKSFTVGRLGGLPRITFESKDDLNALWDLLLESADELGASTGPKTAELEILSNRIDALENNDQCNDTAQKHCRDLIRHLETRHELLRDKVDEVTEDIKYDVDSHGRRIQDLEDAAETAEPATVDDDQLHDAIATYIMDKPNALRRAIIDTITDKLC